MPENLMPRMRVGALRNTASRFAVLFALLMLVAVAWFGLVIFLAWHGSWIIAGLCVSMAAVTTFCARRVYVELWRLHVACDEIERTG